MTIYKLESIQIKAVVTIWKVKSIRNRASAKIKV